MEENHDLKGSDDQEHDDALIPGLGTYMVFTLNPVGTLEHLGDGDATNAARRLPQKKYVAHVDDAVVSGINSLPIVKTMPIFCLRRASRWTTYLTTSMTSTSCGRGYLPSHSANSESQTCAYQFFPTWNTPQVESHFVL